MRELRGAEAPLPSALEHELLRELTADTFGIDLPPARRTSLAARLRPRLRARGLLGFGDYYALLKRSSTTTEEWGHFADAVTNAETYFFRGKGQFEDLVELLPSFDHLRVLSIGCATGEEVYGLAAVLAAHLPASRFEVIGADISTPRLAEAMLGRFSDRSFRAAPVIPGGGRFADHFDRDEQGWRARPALKAQISFHRKNLAEVGGLGLGRFDVVFCRNVLIYAHAEAMPRFLATLADALAPRGYLFLGETETLLGADAPFVARRLGHHFAHVHASWQSA
jgi:chemotaxis protein methyltransferase CheR